MMAQHAVRINPDLIINSAALKGTHILSGRRALLTAKVTGDADSIVVLNADGNPVEFKNVVSSVKNGITTFNATWTVTGNPGDILIFTVIVYDTLGRRSVNTKQVTVTIK